MATILDDFSTNLVSYWELEETSGTRVDSHGSNDLTDNNTVTSTTGIQGNASEFTLANSEYLSKTLGSTGLEAVGTFSVSFWFQLKTTSGIQGLYSQTYDGGFGDVLVRFFSGRLYFTEENVADYLSTKTDFTSGSWYHIVITKNGDGASNLKIYVNGSLDSTHSCGSIVTPDGIFTIGSNAVGSYLNGYVDEFGYWSSRVLDSTEVSTIYNSGSGIPYQLAGGFAYSQAVIIA